MTKHFAFAIFILICGLSKSQTGGLYIVYGDLNYMTKIDSQTFTLNDSLDDGSWQVFYKEDYKDIAMLAKYLKRVKHGWYLEKDRSGKMILLCKYNMGELNGWHYTFTPAIGSVTVNKALYRKNVVIKQVTFDITVNEHHKMLLKYQYILFGRGLLER